MKIIVTMESEYVKNFINESFALYFFWDQERDKDFEFTRRN